LIYLTYYSQRKHQLKIGIGSKTVITRISQRHCVVFNFALNLLNKTV